MVFKRLRMSCCTDKRGEAIALLLLLLLEEEDD
jgi:hypothetical protein